MLHFPPAHQAMPLRVERLPHESWRLLDKFYREQRSAMRAVKGAALWVAREPAIVAGLSLTPVAHGAWLTGLLVASEQRGRQVARRLLVAAVASVDGPIWLFCHPDLQRFYEAVGFVPNPGLPIELEQRLVRYRQNKFLIAMGIKTAD